MEEASNYYSIQLNSLIDENGHVNINITVTIMSYAIQIHRSNLVPASFCRRHENRLVGFFQGEHRMSLFLGNTHLAFLWNHGVELKILLSSS